MRLLAATLVLSLGVSACGGGGGGGGGVGVATEGGAAPVLAVSYGIKSYAFSWTAVAGATAYQLLEDPDGPGPLPAVQVGGDVTGTSTSLPVFLPVRLNASYQVRACAAGGCGAPSAAVQAEVNRAIGYIKASNTEAGDAFGGSVALSADGSTLAVGASAEDSAASGIDGNQADNGAVRAGAVYVFVRSGGAWRQQAYIKASNPELGDGFGTALALSADGSTLAVGAPNERSASSGIDGNQTDNSLQESGAVYVFTRTGTAWSQQAYIKASNPGLQDFFGTVVSLSADGSTLAVGAAREDSAAAGIDGNQADESAVDSGAVYVYTRAGSAWTQQAYMKASNTGSGDQFGFALKLSGDGGTLAVGAVNEDSGAAGIGGNQADNGLSNAGAVYVFTRAGTTWTQQAYVKASNPGSGDGFGVSVSLSSDGNTLAVAADAEDSAATGIGGNQADDSATDSGAVYVFTRSAGVWTQQAYIKANRTVAGNIFGYPVELSGDGNTLAVGADSNSSAAAGVGVLPGDTGTPNAGAAYLFRRSGSTWTALPAVKATNPRAGARFGAALALSGDGRTLAVGSRGETSAATGIGGDAADTSAAGAGAVYLY